VRVKVLINLLTLKWYIQSIKWYDTKMMFNIFCIIFHICASDNYSEWVKLFIVKKKKNGLEPSSGVMHSLWQFVIRIKTKIVRKIWTLIKMDVGMCFKLSIWVKILLKKQMIMCSSSLYLIGVDWWFKFSGFQAVEISNYFFF